MIEQFEIIGLFKDRNIKIDFTENEDIKILIGENGTGKTHILNILYYILSGKLNKLVSLEFEEIILKIKDTDIIKITNKEIIAYYGREKDDNCGCKLKKYLSRSQYLEMKMLISKGFTSTEIINSKMFRFLKFELSKNRLHSMVNEAIVKFQREENRYDEQFIDEVNKKIKMILKNVDDFSKNYSFIYLPTYRRVEEDLETLGLNDIIDEVERSHQDSFIQFGMEDTKRYIKLLTEDIKKLSLEGFSRMSGDIINNLIDNDSNNITFEDKKIIKNIDTLNIILNRSKDISSENKIIILQKVKGEEIFNDNNKQLLSYLTKLIKIYNKQKEKDELIKQFTNICNKYLVGKNFHYDESLVEVYIENELTKKPLNIDTLSSGEKQLVSIFARIYLECKKDFILFIDEPEISMSMEWQKMLLTDILDSKKCKLLFATTHSPFIFSDENLLLENHTVDIVLEATTPYLKNNNEE